MTRQSIKSIEARIKVGVVNAQLTDSGQPQGQIVRAVVSGVDGAAYTVDLLDQLGEPTGTTFNLVPSFPPGVTFEIGAYCVVSFPENGRPYILATGGGAGSGSGIYIVADSPYYRI